MSKKVFVPGEVLRAADVNTYLTGTRNVVINGGFDFWQRGSSFTITSTGVWTSDRWLHIGNGSGSTRTISRQTFAPADIPVQGGDYDFFFRYNQSVAGSGATANALVTRIEDVRTLANGKAVLSFYAKADSARTVGAYLIQRFGSGGSGDVTTASQTFNLTTAWQRFTAVYDVPSISGKTIGAGSYLQLEFTMPLNVVQTVEFFGVQLEEGQTATPFQRNGANIQQELAACQRYYEKSYNIDVAPGTSSDNGITTHFGSTDPAGNITAHIRYAVPKRVVATPIMWTQSGTSGQWQYSRNGASGSATALTYRVGQNAANIYVATGSAWVVAELFGHWAVDAEL